MSKSLSLLLTVLILIISIHHVEDWSTVSIYTGCGLGCRMLYPFYHANLLHALLNAWCLLSIIFIYDISLLRFILAYIIAVTIPSFCLSDTPTVGMSGLVFALFGSISFEVQRKTYYQLYMLAYLVVGFLFPNTNALVHLYCYILGVVLALLNKPVKIR